MKLALSAFFAGLIFAIGLGLGGMTQPHKVIGFLDILGNWDASLMFVMMGALAVHIVSYRLVKKRKTPLLDVQFHLPASEGLVTKRLIIGSALFGAGWGLAGYCPGPAIVSLATGQTSVMVFVLSMLTGMFITRKLLN